MFGSQVLDAAVGLVLMLFILATAASSLLETFNRLARSRAKDLQKALGELLGGTRGNGADATAALDSLRQTSVYAAATDAAGGQAPAYLSAKSFADATLELTAKAGQSPDHIVPRLLGERISMLLQESENDALELRAGLERWFDEAMGRLSDAYKRRASLTLGVIGFLLAVATNASTPDVVARLWTGPVTRESVASAAQYLGQGKDAATLAEVARTTAGLTELSIPIGWVGAQIGGVGWWFGHLLGWALTAVLVMVGAPFWFDLLGRLVTFRSGSAGGQPARADQDPAAATPRVLARDSNPAYIAAVLRAVSPMPTAAAPGASGGPAVAPEVEISVPESPLLRNIKKALSTP